MNILVTNNPMAETLSSGSLRIEYLDTDLPGVLTRVRDYIHKGHRLLTHPLSGSVKPNETLYKSIMISGEQGKTEPQSVVIIEESIQAAQKFPQKEIPDRYLLDLQTVDLSFFSEYFS